MFAGMGAVALAQGDLATARAHSAECLALATRTGARKNLVKAWRLAGEIAQAERDWNRAEGHFGGARELAASLGNPVQHWKTELAFARFLQDAGRLDEAHQAIERARLVLEHVRGTLRQPLLRDALAKNLDLDMVSRGSRV
jgi:hypothetical protein